MVWDAGGWVPVGGIGGVAAAAEGWTAVDFAVDGETEEGDRRRTWEGRKRGRGGAKAEGEGMLLRGWWKQTGVGGGRGESGEMKE